VSGRKREGDGKDVLANEKGASVAAEFGRSRPVLLPLELHASLHLVEEHQLWKKREVSGRRRKRDFRWRKPTVVMITSDLRPES
jgi:hypothetical protein